MFSGIGGFDLALRNLNHTIVGACEIDRYARQVYGRHFPGIKIYENATTIKPEELPDFDILAAGFPCQAFSIAGKRRGFADTRGSLFFEIARVAKEKRPSILLLENVKGLLSHDKGNTFKTIINTLDEIGYDAEWQVLNSKYFVPQNRERIFIIGHFRGERTRQIFPLGESSEQYNKSCREAQSQGQRFSSKYTGALDANYYKGHDNHGARTLIYTAQVNKNMKQKIQTRDDTWTLSTSAKDFGVMEDQRIRRLTPVECERLQGFPDNWTKYDNNGKEISDTQRYKMCGNAVTVPVIEYIISNYLL
tara:strand:- start:26 stop:943 length:918 start_codon:yes stop_codon:yes gene_type:complete